MLGDDLASAQNLITHECMRCAGRCLMGKFGILHCARRDMERQVKELQVPVDAAKAAVPAKNPTPEAQQAYREAQERFDQQRSIRNLEGADGNVDRWGGERDCPALIVWDGLKDAPSAAEAGVLTLRDRVDSYLADRSAKPVG